MRKVLLFSLLPVIVGCLSPAPKAPTCWTVDKGHSFFPVADIAKTADDVRISRVEVRAPYNGMRLAVLRPDGSIAFDPYNVFAVSPSSLLNVAAQDAVRQHGAFKRVISAGSGARARYSLEFDVTTLALECREKDGQEALVELQATLLEGRDIVGTASARASAEDRGDYSEAFSAAFFNAVADAIAKLPLK